jgi:hypothetical protein
MIMGAYGLMLHLWLIVVLTLLVSALCVAAILPRLLTRLACFNLVTQQQLLWCLVLLPYAVAWVCRDAGVDTGHGASMGMGAGS